MYLVFLFAVCCISGVVVADKEQLFCWPCPARLPIQKPKCDCVHECYREEPQVDLYCEQVRDETWRLPADAPRNNCICVSGFVRDKYPDGKCVAELTCCPELRHVY